MVGYFSVIVNFLILVIVHANSGGMDWHAPPESNISPILPIVDPKQNIWLFNITDDPCELHDLSKKNPKVVQTLLDRLEQYWSTSVPVQYPPPDLDANPSKHGNFWGPWKE